MSTPFLGQISLFSFGFAPKGFALCNGQILPINQNQALFSLLGTTYGGNGQTTFALPDLRGRTPLHFGANQGFVQGQASGEENHTLIASEMPAHVHLANCNNSTTGSVADPTGAFWGSPSKNAYTATSPDSTMAANALGTAGGSQPHQNMSPYLTINFCIALTGIFPSRN